MIKALAEYDVDEDEEGSKANAVVVVVAVVFVKRGGVMPLSKTRRIKNEITKPNPNHVEKVRESSLIKKK
jgi:hypothetical protein